jgi:hypothetical protein
MTSNENCNNGNYILLHISCFLAICMMHNPGKWKGSIVIGNIY